jgi:hypothetical protein
MNIYRFLSLSISSFRGQKVSGNEVLVKNFKGQTEACLKFLLPLQEHGYG